MDISEVIEIIRDTKYRGGTWYTMAKLVRAVIRDQAWVGRYPSQSEWIHAAARHSGYSPAAVRRMLRVAEWLERLRDQEGVRPPESDWIPLASLELLERMYPLAPKRALDLLPQAIRGQVTMREVQAAYDAVVAKRDRDAGITRVTPRRAREHRDRAYDAVSDHLFELCGANGFRTARLRRSSFYTYPDMVAVPEGEQVGVNAVDGFKFKVFEAKSIPPNTYQNLVNNYAFSSLFYRRFWLIVSGDFWKNVVPKISSDLDTLRLSWLGIAALHVSSDGQDVEEVSIEVVRRASNNHHHSPLDRNSLSESSETKTHWQKLMVENVGKYAIWMGDKQ